MNIPTVTAHFTFAIWVKTDSHEIHPLLETFPGQLDIPGDLFTSISDIISSRLDISLYAHFTLKTTMDIHAPYSLNLGVNPRIESERELQRNTDIYGIRVIIAAYKALLSSGHYRAQQPEPFCCRS
jgi:hypothetical protein